MATEFPTFVDTPEGETPEPGTPDVDATWLNAISGAVNIVENTLPAKANSDDLATVATSGAYTDLIGTPAIPSEPDDIGAQPAGDYLTSGDVATVATTGAYADLTGAPTIPSTPADVGLGDVDNTSDLDKPISTDTQAALDVLTAADTSITGSISYINLRLATMDGLTAKGNLSGAATFTPDDGNGGTQTATLTQDCTVTFAEGMGDSKVKAIELVLTQGGTGGWTVTWNSTIRWEGGTGAPTLSTAPGAVDRLVFVSYDNGVTWYGDVIGLGYA